MSARPTPPGRRRILAIHTAGHAAGRRRRPRIAGAAHRALHRRRPRGSGPPRRPDRASPRARQRPRSPWPISRPRWARPALRSRPEMLEEYERIQETLKSEATRPMGGIGFVLPGMLRPKAGRQGIAASRQLVARFRGNWRNAGFVGAVAPLKTCQAAVHLPTVAASLAPDGASMPTSPARTLKGPRRVDAPPRSPLAKPAVAVPARFPETSGDGRVDHPVEPGADRARCLRPVDWENTKLFVEYGPGVGTFTRPILDRLAPDATLVTIDTNADFTQYLTKSIDDPRLVAVTGSAADVEKDPYRPRARPGRLRAVGPALLNASAGRRRCHRQSDRQGHPARRRVPGLSVQPQGAAISSSRTSSGSIAASNGSTCRPRPCSGRGASRVSAEL